MPGLKKVLLVEDDENLCDTLAYNLTREGYRVVAANDGRTAIDMARREQPDLIMLDLMLPEIDGFEVCRTIRQEMVAPILILTARDSEVDTVLGLELGADEYVAKPFALRPLLARVKALLRRAEMAGEVAAPTGTDLVFGDYMIDVAGRRLYRGAEEITLTMKEYDLLHQLVTHAGQVLSRDHLLEKVWGYDYAGDGRTVDVHIRWLREKLVHQPPYITTVRGVGYRFEAPD